MRLQALLQRLCTLTHNKVVQTRTEICVFLHSCHVLFLHVFLTARIPLYWLDPVPGAPLDR